MKVGPDLQRGGYYASEFLGSDVLAWAPKPNMTNQPPACTISGQTYYVNGITADQKGNLVVPGLDSSATTSTISVYQGPSACGNLVGTIDDTTGQAVDAAAFNAQTGSIAVSEINYTTGRGDVVICTLAMQSCGAPVTSSAITSFGAGVAMDSAGDCWLSTAAENGIAHPVGFRLIYWQGCSGTGQVATGTANSSYGGLFVDNSGYIGSFDAFGQMLYIYSGCNPTCTLVSSYPLQGVSFFGTLNGRGNRLAVGDESNGSVDIYKYGPTYFAYAYSFNNGLTASDIVESGIFSPTNHPPK